MWPCQYREILTSTKCWLVAKIDASSARCRLPTMLAPPVAGSPHPAARAQHHDAALLLTLDLWRSFCTSMGKALAKKLLDRQEGQGASLLHISSSSSQHPRLSPPRCLPSPPSRLARRVCTPAREPGILPAGECSELCAGGVNLRKTPADSGEHGSRSSRRGGRAHAPSLGRLWLLGRNWGILMLRAV
jgi:hypothetical protein